MKNKNGFTLVELLAVIAILAILVIIALPNVLNMYVKARKSAFLTETKTIYKEAEKKYISGSITNTDVKVINSENDTRLDMTGEKLKYCIVLDNNGKVELLKASNGKYVVDVYKDDDLTSFDLDRIKEGNLDDYKCNGVVPPKSTSCTYDGELVQGAEFVQGKFTYRYMQDGEFVRDGKSIAWKNMAIDGWGVQLTDKTSTEPVVAETCTYINGKPVVSAAMMFSMSQATSIDMSKMNTSNIVSFDGTFAVAEAKTINMKNMDTSNVIDFSGMFEASKVESIDVSDFDTSKAKNIDYMFNYVAATTINGIGNFDTKNVESMVRTFAHTKAINIDVNNFDTSKVQNMAGLFAYSKVKSLDLRNFNTSNVQYMSSMFDGCEATLIDTSSFDTSNVTSMFAMFWGVKIDTIDVSNFNTSKVIDMSQMFCSSTAKKIIGLEKMDTSNVLNMAQMFRETNFTSIDLSNFNTSKVIDMSRMFRDSKMTKLDVSSFDTSSVKTMLQMFNRSAATEIIGLDKFNTTSVTTMQYMFNFSVAEVLDLSSFDITNTRDIKYMFNAAKSKIGYARDDETVAKFSDNSVTSIPSTLKFSVKKSSN